MNEMADILRAAGFTITFESQLFSSKCSNEYLKVTR